MNTNVFDLVSIIEKIEAVKYSHLSAMSKDAIYQEMINSLPPEMFCGPCLNTLAIVKIELGALLNGSTKKPTSESTEKGPDLSPKGADGKRELLLKDDADRGRPRPKKAVVKQAQKKRRAAPGDA